MITVEANQTPDQVANGGVARQVPAGTQPDTPDDTAPESTAPVTTLPEVTEPTLPPLAEPELLVDFPIGDVVDIGNEKPERDYDAFVAVAVSDIQRWWAEFYPDVYGEPFVPLEGGIYAGYPERSSDLPGCGESRTRYEDLALYVAFYCEIGDFMIYDDGDESLLKSLTDEFGPAVMGIVLAHEYGHAIQARIGALDRLLATIYTEQQADCFAGAWTGQAYRRESPMLRLGDADVRAGLIAMLSVRDPVGTDQFVAGGHGSAFDRVGAFQEGFVSGPARCAELLDNPLSLMPNAFQPASADEFFGGNAPYDCSELEGTGVSQEFIDQCVPAPEFLASDLDHFWKTALGDEFPTLTPKPVSSIDSDICVDRLDLARDVVLCESQNTVIYDEPAVLSLYRDYGDFTLGYFYGIAWGERAQQEIGSPLSGEPRALLNDCFTGAWVRDITPDQLGNTRRQGDHDGDGTDDTISSSPGDLDEAIRMAVLVGDPGANDNIVGSPFEKIESFRVGVLGGLDACNARIPG